MINVIPHPKVIVENDGAFDVADLRNMSVNCDLVQSVAGQFRQDLESWTGIKINAARTLENRLPGDIRLELIVGGSETLSPESDSADGKYSLTIDSEGVLISSVSREGIYRGLTTLLQLVATGNGALPFVEIEDNARYMWRGLSVDVARSFSPVEEVKRVIDVMALYKLNVFHLHLNDNEGWRLQLDSRPRLTPPGAEFFSSANLQEITEYANARFITVIPESDFPGHVGAAIKAYPSLNPGVVAGLDDLFPRANLDPDSVDAWDFVDEVLTDLVGFTPGPYIHIGGDEAFGMDDEAHEAFVNRAIETVSGLGKKVVGWQEISRANIGPSQIVQHWIDFSAEGAEGVEIDVDEQSTSIGIPPDTLAMLRDNFMKAVQDVGRIVEKGARVIMSPTGNAYLDRPHAEGSKSPAQNARKSEFGLAFYPPTPLTAYFDWEEYADRLSWHSILWNRTGFSWYQTDSIKWV